MRKRIKTDSIEGLLEIVKAVQQGEDPEEVLKQKEAAGHFTEKDRLETEDTEGAPMADSPKAYSGDGAEDDFAELLNSERAELPDFGASFGKLLTGVRTVFSAREKKPVGKQRKYPDGAQKGEDRRTLNPDSEGQVKKERQTEKAPVREKQLQQDRDLAEAQVDQGKGSDVVQRKEDRTQAQLHMESQDRPEDDDRTPAEKTEDEKILDRILERNHISPDEADADENENGQQPGKGLIIKDRRLESGQKKGEKSKTAAVLTGFCDYIREMAENLWVRGISRKELLMLAAGLALAVLVLAFVFQGIRSGLEQRRKSANVTADKGLKVLVEDEPEGWCTSYSVVLRFKATGAAIKQVSVNGVNYLPADDGRITVETGEWLLELAVTTEEGVLNAQVEIPKLDSQVPVVNAVCDQEIVTLTAADARSGIKRICYAEVSCYTPWELPCYQEYTEPIAYKNNTLYYFYAEDAAGNRSHPTVTTMEKPDALEFEVTEADLFPGETKTLQLSCTPEKALLTNLRFESTDTAVAVVDANGTVTAVAEGTAAIKVNADGVETAACTVHVSRTRSVTVSAIGDCTLGSDEYFNTMTDFNAFYAVNGSGYFFGNVSDILSKDDVTFANLEGTFTTETTRENKQYAFKGSPDYTKILQEGSIEVVTLANNHSSDYGAKSLEDTKENLDDAGIEYCIGDTIVLKEVNGIKTAFIGIYVLADGMGREAQVRETIDAAKDAGARLIITAFHWGSEKSTQPDETQTALAHLAVDCGANLVVGHHPHVLQGIEKYKGVYIVYSLGNFCFGGNSAPSDMDTMIFQQTFTVSEGTVMDDDAIKIIPCSISSISGYNNYQPTPADGTKAEQIMGRINEYSAAFGQSYMDSEEND